jgi:hypothetical protein
MIKALCIVAGRPQINKSSLPKVKILAGREFPGINPINLKCLVGFLWYGMESAPLNLEHGYIEP